MYKKIAVIVIVMLGLAGAAMFAGRAKSPAQQGKNTMPEKIKVTASFYPLAYLAEQVGGDRVEVRSITPNGIEPHDFEPTPQDIITVRSSQVFFYNGTGVDVWAERLQPELTVAGVKVAVASQAVSLRSGDPHIWLDPVRARQIAELIRDTLSAADPKNADYYRTQFSELSGRLTALNVEYEKRLSNCTTRDVVVSHDAFNYVAERYRLNLYPIAGLSPEAEPSAKRLSELAQLVKEKNINTIFFESLVPSDLAETLARETGAKTDVLNPIEGLTEDDIAAGRNYETIMHDNLNALSRAMICQ